ncbi:hypothetical protein [Nonomuraea jabiensis]|uniref:Uncharacterized protein n=1 Tax=Nonomuraea jabiensis TaxID=882448 RepID=A0A7W9G322_9ACTN|nr:hypothetical protein [Nonomuraea jabiensis]MBB5776227.1 hypothetical protein [Nonomuraea jabiensis]
MFTIPVEEITERARQAHPGRALLTAIVLVPWLLGWSLRKLWLGLTILWQAATVGWHDAGGDPPSGGRPTPSDHGPFGGA